VPCLLMQPWLCCRLQVCGMNGATGDLPWPLSFKLVPDADEIEREKRTSFRLPPADSGASPHAEESKL